MPGRTALPEKPRCGACAANQRCAPAPTGCLLPAFACDAGPWMAPIALHFPQVPYVKRVIEEADGIQPHLVAPEAGYRRLLEEALGYLKDPCDKSVEEVRAGAREGEEAGSGSPHWRRLRGWLDVMHGVAGCCSRTTGWQRPCSPGRCLDFLRSACVRPSLPGLCAASPHGGQHCQQRGGAPAAAIPHAAPRDHHRSVPQPGDLQGAPGGTRSVRGNCCAVRGALGGAGACDGSAMRLGPCLAR